MEIWQVTLQHWKSSLTLRSPNNSLGKNPIRLIRLRDQVRKRLLIISTHWSDLSESLFKCLIKDVINSHNIISNHTVELESLKQGIVRHLDSNKTLERLYRENKGLFHKAFNEVYADIKENAVATFWHERLNYQRNEFSFGNRADLIFIIILSLIAGFIANIPNLFGLNSDIFFQKNIAYVVLPTLMAYFSRKNRLRSNKILLPLFAVLLSIWYINSLQGTAQSDTFILACIHLPIFLWTLLGFVFISGDMKDHFAKTDFLRWNGNLLVMAVILVLSGALFSGITLGLFDLLGFDIIEFYMKHIVIWGLAAIPVVANYLVQQNPQLVNNISPVIARIFTPIVFLTLLIFLGAMIFSKESIYHDRNFLIMFNMLLIGVMAIILYAVTEANKHADQQLNHWLLFGVAGLTIILNGIALSAILFRLAEFGITPNRIAVLGANLLIFINLLLVAQKLYLMLKSKTDVQQVERVISGFMPLYSIWAAFVTFILPLLFGFK